MGDTSDQVWVVEANFADGVGWQNNYTDNTKFTHDDARNRLTALLNYVKMHPKWTFRIRNTADPTTLIGNADMKAGLTNGKPQLSQVPEAAMVYMARGHEYGCSEGKYKRGNYLAEQVDLLADFHRLAAYLDAMLRHTMPIALAINRVLGTTYVTEAEMKAAAMCQDAESGLPHLTGMICSAGMAIQQAVDAGLIQSDPGRPWLNKK